MKPHEIENFLKDNQLDYFSVCLKHLKELTFSKATQEELQDITEFISSKANIFKVPWEQALELVRQRRVILKKGFAFVPEEDFASILIGRFRLFLADALATAFKVHSHLGSHFDSISPILNNITTMYVPSDFKLDFTKKAQGKVDLSQIDMVCLSSALLIMIISVGKEIFSLVYEELARKVKREPPLETHGPYAIWTFLERNWSDFGRCSNLLEKRICKGHGS